MVCDSLVDNEPSITVTLKTMLEEMALELTHLRRFFSINQV